MVSYLTNWWESDIEPEDVRPHTHASGVISDLENHHAQLQLHFNAIWDITTEINLRLEQHVLEISKGDFYFEQGEKGLTRLEEMNEILIVG